MLIVHETVTLSSALQSLKKIHHLNDISYEVKNVYRPFWLGKATYHAENKSRHPVAGTIVFLADARVPSWSIVGAYQHQNIDNMLDLREHQVDFVADVHEPDADAEVLQPLLTQADLPTSSKLLSARKLLARTMKLGKVVFDDTVEYHLVFRPYWEIEFKTRWGKTDVALISRDNLLVRKRK